MNTTSLEELTGRLAELAGQVERPKPGESIAIGRAALWDRLDSAVATVEATLRALLDEDYDETRLDGLHDEGFVEGIRGHTRAFTVPELLGFVSTSYKSGLLRVRTTTEDFLVQLESGAVVFAKSDHPPSGQHLTELLVQGGWLRPQDLEEVRSDGHLQEEELVEKLIEGGLVSQEDADAATALQVQALFRRLCSASDAYFCFYDGGSVASRSNLRFNVTQLLLESARLIDEEAHQARLQAERRDAAAGESPVVVAVAEGAEEVAEQERRLRAALERTVTQGDFELPIVPRAASELLAICWDEDCDAEDLRERISGDQGLCAHVLRVANSAAYAPAVPIISIQLAIARLGMEAIREIALALTVKQRAFSVPGWEQLIRELWRGASVTAGFAKAICRRLGREHVRGALVGLLQDVGKPVVLNAIATIQREQGIEVERRLAVELVDEFHAEVGASLASEWSMPAWLEQVLRHHHDEDVRRHGVDTLVANLAERLAAWSLRRDEDEIVELADLPSCTALGLDEEALRQLLAGTDAILREAENHA
jgi:HD-like signal output (HDOD) protein